jgi:hypothetical protein
MTVREADGSPNASAAVVSDALLHIAQTGHLLALVADRVRRVKLMKTMTDQGLTVWNQAAVRYELTAFGRRCLAHSRQNGNPEALTAS